MNTYVQLRYMKTYVQVGYMNTYVQLRYMKTYVQLRKYLVQFLVRQDMFQTKLVEKIKKHVLCSIYFFFENLTIK
jgi:hypothetical protein